MLRRYTRRSEAVGGVNALWWSPVRETCTPGSSGETSTRNQAGSVRALARKRQPLRGSAKATVSRLVSTYHGVRHDVLLAKVAQRINDDEVLHLLKIMLKANGKQGVPQGGVSTPRTQKRTSSLSV